MDLDSFVQRAAEITAVDGLSFQGLIFLMFLSNLSFFCLWICQFEMMLNDEKKQYQLKTVWY